jgi:hypothetical protein
MEGGENRMTINKLEEAFEQATFEIENFLSTVMDVSEEIAAGLANGSMDRWAKVALSAKAQYKATDSDIAFSMVKGIGDILSSNTPETKLEFLNEVNVRLLLRELKKLV